jgi:hypothetical protein
MPKKHPASITVFQSKSGEVRRIASELDIDFVEEPAQDCIDCVRFDFKNLSDDKALELIKAIPRDAYYFKAVIAIRS